MCLPRRPFLSPPSTKGILSCFLPAGMQERGPDSGAELECKHSASEVVNIVKHYIFFQPTTKASEKRTNHSLLCFLENLGGKDYFLTKGMNNYFYYFQHSRERAHYSFCCHFPRFSAFLSPGFINSAPAHGGKTFAYCWL